MTSTTRLKALAATGIAAVTLAACGGGATTGAAAPSGEAGGASAEAAPATDPVTFKLALNQTEEHPSYIALDAFGERLSEATEGRVDIEVFPNETLGAQAESLQLVGDGSVDMAIVSGPQLENLDEDFVVYNLPTVFDSVEHQMSVVNDPAQTEELYASLEEGNNITVVGGLTQGARNFYTKDAPVETPEDLAGKKIRVQESPLFLAMIEALGASPTPMAFGEVYTALQSGVIDGAENNEVSYFTQKHYEVAPYLSYSEHLIGLDYLIINTGALDGLSPEDQEAFATEWTATHEEHTELWLTATEEATTAAEEAGATFTEVDAEAFRTALEPIVDEFLTTDGQQTLFDAARQAAR